MANIIKKIRRKLWIAKLRIRNKNKDFTLLTNNCIGGVIYHDLGLQFRSPTINLMVNNFHLFIEHFDHYINCDLVEIESKYSYPVGQLVSDTYPPITLEFVHYDSFEQAKEKWMERKSRINYFNMFILMECYNDYFPKSMKNYLKLPISKNKAVLVHSPDVNREDVHLVTCEIGTAEKPVWGKIFDIKDNGRRALDDFDYVAFLNGKL